MGGLVVVDDDDAIVCHHITSVLTNDLINNVSECAHTKNKVIARGGKRALDKWGEGCLELKYDGEEEQTQHEDAHDGQGALEPEY
jgi:hypothetical protein